VGVRVSLRHQDFQLPSIPEVPLAKEESNNKLSKLDLSLLPPEWFAGFDNAWNLNPAMRPMFY